VTDVIVGEWQVRSFVREVFMSAMDDALLSGTANYLIARPRPVVSAGDTGTQQNCEVRLRVITSNLVSL